MAAPQSMATNELARIIDVTPDYVRKLAAKGIIQRARNTEGEEMRGRFTLLAVRDYCRYLRTLAHKEDSSEQTWQVLRNQRMAAESEMARLRLDEMKGKLHRADDIDFVLTQMFTSVKQKLLAFPSRVSRQIEGKKFREILAILTKEIYLILRELSKFDGEMVARKAEQYLKAQGEEGSNGSEGATERDELTE
jgi:phage terminase Nu1 subunit (DNA packaging protein)